jgi:hypothetical protein
MAQTKRKRRSKHRGNAAATTGGRGPTAPTPTPEEQRKRAGTDARAERRFVEPSWGSAATRAGLASVMLFVLFQVGLAGEKQTLVTSAGLSVAAFLIYVPLGYRVDRFFWERRMRKAGRPIPPRKAKAKR